MSLQLPEPAPVPAASAAGPGFPVFQPTESSAVQPNPLTPSERTAASQNPLAEFHQVSQNDPGNERELLFTIGGTPFFMPKNPSPQLGFKLLRDTKRHGQMMAIATLIEELLGPECLDALADAPDIKEGDWKVIGKVLSEKVLGKVQNMGKS